MKESKINKILSVTAKTLLGISVLAFAGYVADTTYFHRLNLDFFPTGYVSIFGTLIFGITAGGLSALDRREKEDKRRGLTFESLDGIYQEGLSYCRGYEKMNSKLGDDKR